MKGIYAANEVDAMAKIVFQHHFGWSAADLVLNANQRLTESELLLVHHTLKALKKEEPLQYILGETEFFDCVLKVNPAVLIPRPETEELVDLILKDNPQKDFRIIDLGTGSGAIPIAIKKQRPMATVAGVDVSHDALEVAKANGKLNNTEIAWYLFDVLKAGAELPRGWDIIVSNPPYITPSERTEMERNVLAFEPDLALFVPEDDPLLFYREIIGLAETHLIAGGRLYFEVNAHYGPDIFPILEEAGFVEIALKQDFQGKGRMLSARKP